MGRREWDAQELPCPARRQPEHRKGTAEMDADAPWQALRWKLERLVGIVAGAGLRIHALPPIQDPTMTPGRTRGGSPPLSRCLHEKRHGAAVEGNRPPLHPTQLSSPS